MKHSKILGAGMLLLLTVLGMPARSQCVSFKLSDRGDTLNCVDKQGLKQGNWLIKVPELRGQPGHDEEGTFKDGRKEGIWRSYNVQGDVLSVESYKWGLLNGKSQYYSVLGLEREESWWAIDPSKKYDTVDVPDLYEDGKYTKVVVKNEFYSMKHGKWTWYDPQNGFVQRTEDFFRDSAVNPLGMFGVKVREKPQRADSILAGKKPAKPNIVEAWEKKNAGKKKVVVRDGSAGF
ncbi:MAG: hypothetical protein EAY75_07035 [Bacteroidetes bacterium]|nr:MAG: hypothetical protein EAY75_07035 [Bacteroidota bacterium]